MKLGDLVVYKSAHWMQAKEIFGVIISLTASDVKIMWSDDHYIQTFSKDSVQTWIDQTKKQMLGTHWSLIES